MMTTVALLKCDGYHLSTLKAEILRGLYHVGLDLSAFRDRRVLLKPNLLNASPVEKAVVTHPEFFRAVLQLVKAHGGRPFMAESPAFQPLSKVMKKTGYERVIAEEDCEIADPNETAVLFHQGPAKYRRFELSKALFDADLVLNLPKFKTHGLTYITGAVKNSFGLIQGLKKSQWHLRARSSEAFSGLLLDLYLALTKGFDPPKRYMHIMDAITGLEGEGPGASGHPKKVGAVVIGEDAVAVDSVAVSLAGLDKRKVHTLRFGEERGLGTASLERIRIKGARLEDFDIRDFVPSRATRGSHMERWPLNTKTLKNVLMERPVPSRLRCTLCYQCRAICPSGAIGREDGKIGVPRYDYDKCIRCYCCMEICPEAAIALKRGKLQWLINR